MIVKIEIYAQSAIDTIIDLKGLEVIEFVSSDKPNAGMKREQIDTIFLIKNLNVSLSDLLSKSSTIYIKENGRGSLTTASFRGGSTSHTQVNWNGIELNSPMTGIADFSLIPVFIIDDLWLNYGAASIVDGCGGIGGAVNISNVVNWNNKIKVTVLQGVGSYHTYDEFLSFNVGNSKIQSKSRLYCSYSKNNYTFENKSILNYNRQTNSFEHPIDTNNNASFYQYGFLQEVYYKFNDNNIFSVKYWYQQSDRALPKVSSYEGANNANINNQEDMWHKATINFTRYNQKSKLQVQSAFSFQNTTYQLKNNIIGVGMIPAIYAKNIQKSLYNKLLYGYYFKHNFLLEINVSNNYLDVSSIDTVKKEGYNNNRYELLTHIAAGKTFFNRLKINLIIKQDLINNKFTPIIPFVGINYKILKAEEFYIKGNISRIYHYPSLNDKYMQPGGNPNILSEQGFSTEISSEYSISFCDIFHLKAEITAFYKDINNWIVWLPTYQGYWSPMNVSNVLSNGLEGSFKYNVNYKKLSLSFYCSYTLTSTKNYGDTLIWGKDSYGKQLAYIPLHSFNFYISLSYQKWFLAWQHNHYSERFTTSNNEPSERNWLYPYFMNDLSCGKEFNLKKIKLSIEFKINNLFNETYRSVLFYPMPKRNYYIQLMINY